MSHNIMERYSKFIRNEIDLSNKVLHSLQVFDLKFSEAEYCFIKQIFMNHALIGKIYKSIEGVIGNKKGYNIDLVVGDFLFSMTSFGLRDPANLFLKTNRADYLRRIELRSAINHLLGYKYQAYMRLHRKILIALRVDGVIRRTQVKSKGDKSWSTVIYFHMDISDCARSQHPIGYSTQPFVLIELSKSMYSMGSFRNLWKVKRKKKEMEDFPLSFAGVSRANRIALKLSKSLYDMNQSDISYFVNSQLRSVNCTNTNEYFYKVEKVIKDNNYSLRLSTGVEKITGVGYGEIAKLRIEIIDEYKETMRLFQKIMSVEMLKKINFGEKIYLPCFSDNRGRQYYATLISPTFYKMFRFLYEFYDKKEFVDLNSSTYYKKVIEHRKIVLSFGLDEKNSYIALVLLLEIGKFFAKSDDGYFIKTRSILEFGMENFKKKNLELSFEDKMYVKKIYSLLDNLLEDREIDNNTIIFKDATASGLQNYGMILGYKKEMLKYINIDGDDWCDTYRYLMHRFLNTNLEYIRKRKYWKSTIMTIPYNAEWYGCFIKLIEALRSDGIEYNKLESGEKEEIKKSHKNFFNDIKRNIKKEFYLEESKGLKTFKYNKWTAVYKKEYKITYKKMRDKYIDTLYMISEDKKATERALEANNMHYLDAELVKKVLQKFDVLTVHDCFGIRLSELHLVMDEINKYYSNGARVESYSIHVIL